MVQFQADSATFYFQASDVKEALMRRDDQVGDGRSHPLIETLLSDSGLKIIVIPDDDRDFPFIVLDLLKAQLGSVYCHTCMEEYGAGELKSALVGHGKTPLSSDSAGIGRFIKGVLRGNRKRLSLTGGAGYACPSGHDVISKGTWVS